MLYKNLSHVQFKKYKRFFAIGCSFTNYRYATWADIIGNEVSSTGYINLGKCGAGQQYIFITLSQAIKYYNIGPGDLVGIMWSTFYREDRVLNKTWLTPGNIYSQGLYNDGFMEYADMNWYTLRDLAIIDSTHTLLEHAKFDSFCGISLGIDDQLNMVDGLDPKLSSIATQYHTITEKALPVDLFTFQGKEWKNTYFYEGCNEAGLVHGDYHPSTLDYYNYLTYCGATLSADTWDYTLASHNKMLAVTSMSDITKEGWQWNKSPPTLI